MFKTCCKNCFFGTRILTPTELGSVGAPQHHCFQHPKYTAMYLYGIVRFSFMFLSWKSCGTRVTLSTDQRKQLLNDNKNLYCFLTYDHCIVGRCGCLIGVKRYMNHCDHYL